MLTVLVNIYVSVQKAFISIVENCIICKGIRFLHANTL